MLGLVAVSLATPFVCLRLFEHWFSPPEMVNLAPLTLASATTIAGLWFALANLPEPDDCWRRLPFMLATGLFFAAFLCLAYSFHRCIVPERLTIAAAAAAPESLLVILLGVVFVIAIIVGTMVFAHSVFRGKTTARRYD